MSSKPQIQSINPRRRVDPPSKDEPTQQYNLSSSTSQTMQTKTMMEEAAQPLLTRTRERNSTHNTHQVITQEANAT